LAGRGLKYTETAPVDVPTLPVDGRISEKDGVTPGTLSSPRDQARLRRSAGIVTASATTLNTVAVTISAGKANSSMRQA
jgi:hypothetical protein